MSNSSPSTSDYSHKSDTSSKKVIILCCDGTACTAFKGDNKSPPTNVARIARCINPISLRGIPQVVHYMPGIGTGEESEWNPLNSYNLGIGRGVQEKIIEGYSFICHNYQTIEDKIILIGFSRGAFIVRCIADLVCRIGILTKFGVYYVREIYDMWRHDGENGTGFFNTPDNTNFDNYAEKFEWFELDMSTDEEGVGRTTKMHLVQIISQEKGKVWVEGRMNREDLRKSIQTASKKVVRRGIQIEVCAVWDTVAALGTIVPRLGFLRPRKSKKLGFIHSDFNPGIKNAFQALSLHDRRRSFLPMVWRRPNGDHGTANGATQRLEQCWFMGYHSDIGGGTHGEGLAHFPLAWMLARLWTFVDMNVNNFWCPHLGVSNWCVVDDEVRLQIKSKDTLSLLYRFGGVDCRQPRRQFWTKRGFQELSNEELNNESNDSNEYMHFTVRFLASERLVKPCKTLRDTHIPDPLSDDIVWKLPIVSRSVWEHLMHWFNVQFNPKDASQTDYPVREFPKAGDRYRELGRELVLLQKWTDTELDAMQHSSDTRNAELGKRVAELKAFMDNVIGNTKEEIIKEMSEEVDEEIIEEITERMSGAFGRKDQVKDMMKSRQRKVIEHYLANPFVLT
ncbi:hypothetical protein F5Y12DRAFT_791757 [Xylaria sp. FL1777]|nr:hypothetical protein F5Y12DRAFT_791757 [Xylaria sp. FL1777]